MTGPPSPGRAPVVSRRAALLVGLAAVGTVTVAGSQFVGTPAATAAGPPTDTAGRPISPAAASFRSVRSYPQVPLPVRLVIPALRVDSPLQALGQAPDRTIEVPTDYAVAGWFAEGPRPGQAGPAVILGHVDSTTGPAVFYRLAGIAPGAAISVLRADGSTIGFRVSEVQHVPKTRFPTEQVYGASLQPSLRLVTCGGRFDRTRLSYDDNVIVYAELAS